MKTFESDSQTKFYLIKSDIIEENTSACKQIGFEEQTQKQISQRVVEMCTITIHVLHFKLFLNSFSIQKTQAVRTKISENRRGTVKKVVSARSLPVLMTLLAFRALKRHTRNSDNFCGCIVASDFWIKKEFSIYRLLANLFDQDCQVNWIERIYEQISLSIETNYTIPKLFPSCCCLRFVHSSSRLICLANSEWSWKTRQM